MTTWWSIDRCKPHRMKYSKQVLFFFLFSFRAVCPVWLQSMCPPSNLGRIGAADILRHIFIRSNNSSGQVLPFRLCDMCILNTRTVRAIIKGQVTTRVGGIALLSVLLISPLEPMRCMYNDGNLLMDIRGRCARRRSCCILSFLFGTSLFASIQFHTGSIPKPKAPGC